MIDLMKKVFLLMKELVGVDGCKREERGGWGKSICRSREGGIDLEGSNESGEVSRSGSGRKFSA